MNFALIEGRFAAVARESVTARGTAPASFASGLLGLGWPDYPLLDELAAMISAEYGTG